MKKLKGFLFAKSSKDDPLFLCNKLHCQANFVANTSFSEILKKDTLIQEKVYLLLGENFTLGFTEYINSSNIKYLSVFERCMIFEMDFITKKHKIQIFKNGEKIGERKDTLQIGTKKTKGIFGIFNSGKIVPDFELAVFNFLDLVSKSIQLPSLLSSQLKKESLKSYSLSPLSKKYTDSNSYSTNATPFSGNLNKIMSLMPKPNGYPLPFQTDFDGSPMTEGKYAQRVTEYLRSGVVSPALLIQHNPLCVAVYSSDLDGILFLNFNKKSKIAEKFKQYPKMTKLLSVNMYGYKSSSGLTDGTELDIIEGPNSSKMWKNFIPHILDFLVDDRDKPLLNYWKNKFTKEDWSKLHRMTVEYTNRYPNGFRIGFLMYSQLVSLSFVQDFFPQYLEGGDVQSVGKD